MRQKQQQCRPDPEQPEHSREENYNVFADAQTRNNRNIRNHKGADARQRGNNHNRRTDNPCIHCRRTDDNAADNANGRADGGWQTNSALTQKLKGIVSDVFSIAKATSGVDVNLTKLDFVMLLNQCIADAEDKIADSGKIVKININADSAMVMGDGDKLYRVFQNIVDNALNYSMDGTRIFLDVYKKADRIVFAEKNISATPINFTEEEILERFVRGDKSRTDGGSGLGLSISKSFTEACGGIFNIEIDGDMFKAIVEMPIIQEDTAEKTDDKTE